MECSIEVAHIFELGMGVMGTNQHLLRQVMAGATVVAEMVVYCFATLTMMALVEEVVG